MTDHVTPLEPDEFLAHARFVRTLAHSLVHDEQQADDIVQRTWLAVLTRPGVHQGRVRAWLRAVIQNFARQSDRARLRRDAHEHAAAVPEAVGDAAQTVERIEAHRVVVECVLALAEPYRSAIVMRFFDELGTGAIAERLGVPVETVRTRLKRALALLRSDLDVRFGGDRRTWVVALDRIAQQLPVEAATVTGSATLAAVGGALSGSKAAAVLAAALIVLLGGASTLLFVLRRDPPGRTEAANRLVAADGGQPASTESHRSDAPATPQRHEVAAESALGSRLNGKAKLMVEVVAKETGDGLDGVGLHLQYLTYAQGQKTGMALPVTDPEHPVTDGEGKGEIIAAPDEDYDLYVYPGRKRGGETHVAVPALAKDEERSLVIEITTAYRPFHGRVVAAEDGAPLANATVLVRDGGAITSSEKNGKWVEESETFTEFARLQTGDDGSFQCSVPTWGRVNLWVEAADRALRISGESVGHETAATAAVIPLPMAASLLVSITGAPGISVRDVTVRVTARRDDLHVESDAGWTSAENHWTVTTDVTGRGRMPGLPPQIELTLELLRSESALPREPMLLTLEPGEQRELVISLGASSMVRGSIVDQAKAPVANQTVWLLRAEDRGQLESSLFFSGEGHAKAVSDERGQFQFDDVAAGDWVVGTITDEQTNVAPAIETLHVAADSREAQVVLRVHRALFIRGQVVDRDGHPITHQTWRDGTGWNICVEAARVDDRQRVSTEVNQDGSFALGPLLPGRHELRLDWLPVGHNESLVASGRHLGEPVIAVAGDDGVRLMLSPGGAVQGRVLDAENREPCDAEVEISPIGALDAPRKDCVEATGGSFRFEHLSPGRYSLFATTKSGRAALPYSVQVVAGKSVSNVVLLAGPAGKLRVRFNGADIFGAGFEIRSGTTTLVSRSLERIKDQFSSVEVLPAGSYSLSSWVLRDFAKPPVETARTVTVVAGEEREVVIATDG